MYYKVLIPAAGTGSRLGGRTKYLNKTLISVGNKPALSRIIDMFPTDTEFVIPVGYKGELIKEFISLAYPKLKVQFVDILLYEGEGSGIGLTILTCKDYLQCPFVFCSGDTLVNEPICEPEANWMAYDFRDNCEQYRTINVGNQDVVLSINEKGENITAETYPYIGLAGIKDYEKFWDTMANSGTDVILQGEALGLRSLENIEAKKYTWYDIGVNVELEATRKRFDLPNSPNILEKDNEAIWFLNNAVIKFSDDTKFISDRVSRAKTLGEFVPQINGHTTHMYKYDYVVGDVLSNCVSIPVFEKFLEFSKRFWKTKELDDGEQKEFYDACLAFYKTKTLSRIEMFYDKFSKIDSVTVINGEEYPKLCDLLGEIDWNDLALGQPGQFHGDYHFENIVYDNETQEFKLLDWRQNFGKSVEIGDIYYDLAKLLHGLIISHEIIAKDAYVINWEGNEIKYDFNRKQKLVECEQYYNKWLENNDYDVKKVKTLTALIFLNIAPLHHYPYVLLLYALGKQMLYQSINSDKDEMT